MFGITLEELKAFIGYADTTRDVQLQVSLDAGYEALKQVLQQNLEYGLYEDTFQYRDQRMYLRESPVEEIMSVMQGDAEVDPSEFRLFPKNGLMFFPTWRRMRADLCDTNLFVVQYVGGYQTLPADIKVALFNAVHSADMAASQLAIYGGPLKRLAVYDVGVTDFATSKDGWQFTLRDMLEKALAPRVAMISAIGGWVMNESVYVGTAPGSP